MIQRAIKKGMVKRSVGVTQCMENVSLAPTFLYFKSRNFHLAILFNCKAGILIFPPKRSLIPSSGALNSFLFVAKNSNPNLIYK